MSIEINELNNGKMLEAKMSGRLAKDDYEKFVPVVERLIKQHGKIRVLVEMHDFHGWTAGALWEDVKFDLKHFKDIERLAIVGETRWQEGMSRFCKPFTTAQIQYFDHSKAGAAQIWIEEKSVGAPETRQKLTS